MTPRIITEAEIEAATEAGWNQSRRLRAWNTNVPWESLKPTEKDRAASIIRAAIKSLGLKLESKKGTRK